MLVKPYIYIYIDALSHKCSYKLFYKLSAHTDNNEL